MYRKTTTPEIDAIWDAFNAEVFAAASAHLPHDVDAYEHARARAYAKAIGAVNAITREQLERRWRQPASLVPFDSDLS